MNDKILSMAKEMEAQLIQDRRYFHQNPELSFEESGTASYICKRLDSLGIPYRDKIAKTGILAEVKGREDGKCLLIRADMDALPVEEKADVPYCSKNAGVMHACGHDAHTAILLNTCELLHNLRDSFSGTIKFAFQPGEETDGGAKPMIDAGILENPKVHACIALHVDSDIPAGCIRVKKGPMYASPDNFYITVKGKGGHAAEPQHAIDPIRISAEIISKLQGIPQENAVVTVATIHAGDATNVIPDTASISGTARSLNCETRAFLEKSIESVVRSVCNTYNASYEYYFEKLFPPLVNDENITDLIAESAVWCLGEEACIKGGVPTMAGEDFSYFSLQCPSALFKLGCRNEEKGIVAPIHNSLFDIDESSLVCGLSVFTSSAIRFLQEK